MQAFFETSEDFSLRELESIGNPYTWYNKKHGKDDILARLNRFLSSFDWINLFPMAKSENLNYFGSYHRPVCLCVCHRSIPVMDWHKKWFTFEHKWLLEDDFSDFLKKKWMKVIGIQSLLEKLSRSSEYLRSWAGECFSQLAKRINNLRKEHNRLMDYWIVKDKACRIREVEKEIEKLSYIEEIRWKQRADNPI